MSRKLWIALTLAALLVIGTGILLYARSRALETVEPRRGDLTEAVYGLGKVKSDERFEVKLGVIATVKRLFVTEGDFVKKGAPLIAFESIAMFRAPFDGTVTMVAAHESETVLPHAAILRLEDLHRRYIELSLEQEAALRVRKGQPAKVSFESLRGQVLEGRVKAIFPREDEFLAHVDVPGLGENVLPGMTADVSVEIGTIEDALLIPLKAISNGMVSLRRNGRRQKVKVDIGHVDGMWAEVKGNGIRPGDEILVRKGAE